MHTTLISKTFFFAMFLSSLIRKIVLLYNLLYPDRGNVPWTQDEAELQERLRNIVLDLQPFM